MSLRRVSLDNHVITANKIGVTYTWRSNDNHSANSIPLLSRQLVPNQPSVVPAARKTVNPCYRFVAANTVEGHPKLRAVCARITSHVENLTPETNTLGIFQR